MTAEVPAGSFTPETDPLLLDTMLGKLAVYLRMAGYDAAYAGDRGVEADDTLRGLARDEGRVLVTRDVELAATVDDALLLAQRDPADQFEALQAAGFTLTVPDEPARCGRCNGRLEPMAADADRPAYAPAEPAVDCWRCVSCGQVFWKGSHWDRVVALLDAIGEPADCG